MCILCPSERQIGYRTESLYSVAALNVNLYFKLSWFLFLSYLLESYKEKSDFLQIPFWWNYPPRWKYKTPAVVREKPEIRGWASLPNDFHQKAKWLTLTSSSSLLLGHECWLHSCCLMSLCSKWMQKLRRLCTKKPNQTKNKPTNQPNHTTTTKKHNQNFISLSYRTFHPLTTN